MKDEEYTAYLEMFQELIAREFAGKSCERLGQGRLGRAYCFFMGLVEVVTEDVDDEAEAIVGEGLWWEGPKCET